MLPCDETSTTSIPPAAEHTASRRSYAAIGKRHSNVVRPHQWRPHRSHLSASRSSDLKTASYITDVQTALSTLHTREDTLSTRLDALLDAHSDLNHDLLRLDSLRATLSAPVIAARFISNSMLAGAANTAGRLSGRVRALDLEKSRVEDTLRIVEQVVELKACVAGVVGSMGAPQDWEAAAGYIARAGRIPDEIVRGGFANAMVPTVEAPDAPAVTLETAKECLCGLFLREFEKAAQDGDGERVTRFFKLFPLIGRLNVGLDMYGRYVCQGVAGTARAVLKEGMVAAAGRRDGFFYANALTKLFEHIAQIVDGHGGLVERHYGPGKMVRVIEKLQMEADVQGGIILDAWSDERGVDQKLTGVKSYPFSLLVQGFLPPPKGITGTSRVNSPALGGSSNNPRNSEDEGVNIKEVDALLSEIAVMLGRWSLYSRFIARKCRDAQAPEDTLLAVPDVLTRSNLHRKVSGKLIIPYNVMSTFFFRRSIEKAFQLDESPSGLSLSMNKPIDSTPPYIISAVDDIMYVVNAVIQRSISTSQQEVVGSVIPTIARVLGYDFVGMLQRKMYDESFPKPVIQGGFPPEDKIIFYIVLINSLDMADEYLARIMSSRLGTSTDQPNGTPSTTPSILKESFPFENNVTFVTNALHTLSTSFTLKTTELRNKGIQVLFNQVVKPRLRPVLTDSFRNADYTLSEEDLAELTAQNNEDDEHLEVPRRFEHGWDALVKPIARIMTPKTFATLLDITAMYLSRVLEKRVWSYAGRTTAYGAIRMERDLSGIVGAVARGNYALREVFGKTMQILVVANMEEEEEWEELRGQEEKEDGMVWVLSEEEKRRARNLVRD